ncbi:MAG: GFA family protein [Gammaproteobacteria bacterium]|nr:GFA family protein [Gammaproteobacteria bacterium]
MLDDEDRMMSDIANGGCLCGAVRFEVAGPPLWVAHCHCHSCRRSTGAPVTTFVGFRYSNFTFNTGSSGVYESSPGVWRRFCTTCGTPLSYEADRYDDEIHIYISTLDHPEDYPAQSHVFYGERISWFDVHDSAPRFVATARERNIVAHGPVDE